MTDLFNNLLLNSDPVIRDINLKYYKAPKNCIDSSVVNLLGYEDKQPSLSSTGRVANFADSTSCSDYSYLLTESYLSSESSDDEEEE